jgi:hypothetical protein
MSSVSAIPARRVNRRLAGGNLSIVIGAIAAATAGSLTALGGAASPRHRPLLEAGEPFPRT